MRLPSQGIILTSIRLIDANSLSRAVNLLCRSFLSEYIDEDVFQLYFLYRTWLNLIHVIIHIEIQLEKSLRGWMTCLSVALAIWMPRSILCQAEFSLFLWVVFCCIFSKFIGPRETKVGEWGWNFQQQRFFCWILGRRKVCSALGVIGKGLFLLNSA